jgi:hypothetical protein
VRRNRDHGSLILLTPDGLKPLLLKPGKSWIEVVRCCDMNGVTASNTLADMNGTATIVAPTATAKFPALTGKEGTQAAIFAQETNVISAATSNITLAAPTTGPTPTQQTVGLSSP